MKKNCKATNQLNSKYKMITKDANGKIKVPEDYPNMRQCHNSLCDDWDDKHEQWCNLGESLFFCKKASPVWTRAGARVRRTVKSQAQKNRDMLCKAIFNYQG